MIILIIILTGVSSMITREIAIIFTLHFNNKDHIVQTYRDEYYSLMTLISDKLQIPGFGLCCGMGSCETCLVEICNKERNYKTSILACSVGIDDRLADKIVLVPNQVY